MTWPLVYLRDGQSIYSIAFGAWTSTETTMAVQVEQAIEAGFRHIDINQAYRNETSVGHGLLQSEVGRQDLYLTLTASAKTGKDIRRSLVDSLERLQVKSVDLFLLPRELADDLAATWRLVLALKSERLVKSVGVSNFSTTDLRAIRNAGLELPVLNVMALHHHSFEDASDVLEFLAAHSISTQVCFSVDRLDTSTEAPSIKIAERHGITAAEVYLAWTKTRRPLVVIPSPQTMEEMQGYIRAGALHLTTEELAEMDAAGRHSFVRHIFLQTLRLVVGLAAVFVCLSYLRLQYVSRGGGLR